MSLNTEVKQPTGLFISAVGAVLFLVNLDHALVEPPVTVALFLGTALPGFLSLLVVAAGVLVATADIGRKNARIFLGWVVVGTVTTAGIGVATNQYELAHDVVLVHPEHIVLNNVTGGVIGGLFVGYFHTQTRQRTTLLAEQRDTLAEQREKLEVLNRIIRHDIQNDLTVAQGMIALERDERHERHDGDDESEEEYLQRAERALTDSSHLLETVGEFIEREREREHERDGSTNLIAVNVPTVLQRQVDSVRESYPSATIRLGEVPDVDVRADDMLTSVVRNLLTNAIQHNDADDPQVTVAVTERESGVRITVADNGPGIPDEVKETVFERGETRLESGGTGIGLYLVTMLVEQYGGSVWIEDNHPTGNVFTVELQRA